MRKILYSLFFGVLFCTINAQSLDSTTQDPLLIGPTKGFFGEGMEYQIRGQFSIGGSGPLGFPATLREIKSYNPTLLMGLEAQATKWLGATSKWGLRTGIRVEGRGMKTDARVKNYYTQLSGEEGKQTRGYFTGSVTTTMKNAYVSLPILASYRLTPTWNLYGGMYFSMLLDRDFTGYVYDGVLREGSPIGNSLEFFEDAKGDYDFSNDLRSFQWGGQVGAEYQLRSHLKVFTDVTWGFNGLFQRDFEAISFNMYSIYANLGFAYVF